tara:strand:- start:662 stop:976 length:315 start_codon:yes stop_codon:yes gene_type:complete
MIYELRIYRFHPGKKKEFLENFKLARKFMKKYGVTFVAAWDATEKDDEFVWIRAFPSEKARDKAIDAYYGSPEWAKIVDKIRPTIRRREVHLMKALPNSAPKLR